jgi:hypothetical protein
VLSVAVATISSMADESGECSDDSLSDKESQQSAEDVTSALGELFADQYPSAQNLIDDLARKHPDVDDNGRIRLVKKHAVKKLAATSGDDDAAQQLRETVAELAIAIALLRGLQPRTKEEFAQLGVRIMTSAEKTASLHHRVGTAVPQAVSGFEKVARHVQPAVAEHLFRALIGFKPARPGVARDAYKNIRSTVWRARYNRGVSAAAAGGASAAVVRTIDAAAPRLIVRMVDRSLRLKHGKSSHYG